MSPRKKKRRTDRNESPLKRANPSEDMQNKRPKSEQNDEEEIQAQRRKNFVTACEQVSCKAFHDYRSRLMLIFTPPCINNNVCKTQDNIVTKKVLNHVEELFMTDIRANMWSEALEVCFMTITPTQYLSANILKEVVEIMLNAHHDEYADYTIPYLLNKCQQVLGQNNSIHPPCLTKPVTQMYLEFLTSPLDLKAKTFTNRTQFNYNKGIIVYCLNRLEHELSRDSPEESIVDKCKNIPQEMQQTLQGLHWQKEKFEIYECLERTDRIDRLMAVLESIVEILQFDLAIWLCRYNHNLGNRILKSNRPIMACILWPNNVLYTGNVTNECKQIIRVFVQMVHLQCPENHIEIVSMWLNVVIQIFYICEKNSNTNYPNTDKYSLKFANEFYKIIAEMPNDSIIRIIKTVQPSFMRHLIGTVHLKKILSTEQNCVLKMLIDVIKESKWQNYPEGDVEMETTSTSETLQIGKCTKLRHLIKICMAWQNMEGTEENTSSYPRMSGDISKVEEINCSHVVQMLYTTFEAYIDAYSVRNVQETIEKLNEKLVSDDSNVTVNETLPELSSYSVTVDFIKKYRSIYQELKELVMLFQSLKSSGGLPDALKIFENLDLIET